MIRDSFLYLCKLTINSSNFACNRSLGGGGGGDSLIMKEMGMLVLVIRGVNLGLWSHIHVQVGCFGHNTNIAVIRSCLGMNAKKYQNICFNTFLDCIF